MFDEELASRYIERGVPTEWEEITPKTMAPAYRCWYRALPSPKSGFTGADDAELLIHDPLSALREARIIGDDDWPRISTHVVNHDKTLNRFIMYALVVASTNPSTVGITLVKEEE